MAVSSSTLEEVTALRADNERLAAEREHYRELYLRTLEQCRKLELGVIGQKTERLSPNDAQLTMQVLATLLGPRGNAMAAEPSVDEQRVREHTRAKPTGRKPLPDHLPRVDVELLPEEVEREGRDAFDDAGEVNAAFASLLASCQLHGIEPWAYLRDLFCLLPSWPARRVLELAPVSWRRPLDQPDVQRRLSDDIFRRATLQQPGSLADSPVAAHR